MLKLSVKETINLPTGWQTVTISKAVDGEHNDKRVVDLYFEDLPESVNCRIWSANDVKTGENYGIGNLFLYANAGVTVESDGISIDDNTDHLVGKKINVLFYENAKGYTDIVPRIVPISGDMFNDKKVAGIKAGAQKWLDKKMSEPVQDTTVSEVAPF